MSTAKHRHGRRRRAQARARRSYSFRLTSWPVLVTDGPGVVLACSIPDWAGD